MTRYSQLLSKPSTTRFIYKELTWCIVRLTMSVTFTKHVKKWRRRLLETTELGGVLSVSELVAEWSRTRPTGKVYIGEMKQEKCATVADTLSVRTTPLKADLSRTVMPVRKVLRAKGGVRGISRSAARCGENKWCQAQTVSPRAFPGISKRYTTPHFNQAAASSVTKARMSSREPVDAIIELFKGKLWISSCHLFKWKLIPCVKQQYFTPWIQTRINKIPLFNLLNWIFTVNAEGMVSATDCFT